MIIHRRFNFMSERDILGLLDEFDTETRDNTGPFEDLYSSPEPDTVAQALAFELQAMRRHYGVSLIQFKDNENTLEYWYTDGPDKGQKAVLKIGTVGAWGNRVFVTLSGRVYSFDAHDISYVKYARLNE